MKAVLVVIDGLGDRPIRKIGGKTPLEAADTANLDFLASYGRLGYMYSVKKGYAPESDTAVVSLLGNDGFISKRGIFEAIGAGLDISRGDLCLRTNFATIDNIKSKKVVDRRAGRTLTTKEASILADAINKQVKLLCKFIFKNTIQHRGALVFKGGFSDNITNTDNAYHIKGKFQLREKFKFSEALDEEENSKYSANILNEFTEQSYHVLDQHPINQKRRRKGLQPANIILTRDPGTEIPDLKKLKKWLAIVNMPLEIGITKVAGMDVFSFPYPRMRKIDVYKNLHAALKKACKFSIKTLRRNLKKYNYAYVHFKETDVPGHDNKPHEKMAMLERIDKYFFYYLNKLAIKHDIRIVVTGDHATPCSLKSHSADPVPVLVSNWEDGNRIERQFSEKECKKYGEISVKDLLGIVEGKIS